MKYIKMERQAIFWVKIIKDFIYSQYIKISEKSIARKQTTQLKNKGKTSEHHQRKYMDENKCRRRSSASLISVAMQIGALVRYYQTYQND